MAQVRLHQQGWRQVIAIVGGRPVELVRERSVSNLWLEADEVSWVGADEDGATLVHVAQDYSSPYRVLEGEGDARAKVDAARTP